MIHVDPGGYYTRPLTHFLHFNTMLVIDDKMPLAYNSNAFLGEVLELADRRDLGSRAATRESSTLSFPIPSKKFLF